MAACLPQPALLAARAALAREVTAISVERCIVVRSSDYHSVKSPVSGAMVLRELPDRSKCTETEPNEESSQSERMIK